MKWDEFSRTYEIVGSTVKPADDALPLRLTPVFRDRTPPFAYFLSVESDDSDEPPTLIPDDAEWVHEQIQVTCDPPHGPRPGHWLMKLKEGEPPQYIDSRQLPTRLQAVYEEALAQAECALASGDVAAARRHLFFAARAHPSVPAREPLPQLALIPLLRPLCSSDDLEFFIDDLKTNYQKSQLEAAVSRMKKAHQPLWHRLSGDQGFSRLGLESGQAVASVTGAHSFLDRRRGLNTMLPNISTLREFWTTTKLPPLQPALRMP